MIINKNAHYNYNFICSIYIYIYICKIRCPRSPIDTMIVKCLFFLSSSLPIISPIHSFSIYTVCVISR